jgi:DNA adenine methylase
VFARDDFAALAGVLASIRGRFVLTVNDRPETRSVFAPFGIESVATRYTIAGGKWADVTEIIVTGPGREMPANSDRLL